MAMRITANRGTALNIAFLARPTVYQTGDEALAESKSLTIRSASAASSNETTMPARPLAAFLAQLIARAQDLPVSRERRRADPAEGASIYRAMSGLGSPDKSKNIRLV
jgi:hypothetical protein